MSRMLSSKPATEWPPPRVIPPALYDEFTQHGQMPQIQASYRAERYSGTTAHTAVWTREHLEILIARHRRGQKIGGYDLYEENSMKNAIHAFSIAGLDGAVIGSKTPWVEAIMFAGGARGVTTIEYGTIDSRIPNHTAFIPSAFAAQFLQAPIQFDWVSSISSLEHSGLGRYGDSLNPRGDIDAAEEVYCMLKPGGYFFISLPYVKKSNLVWNAHRRYGPERMRLFAAPFNVIADFGIRWEGQGVFVLRKPFIKGSRTNSTFLT
jgi:hypothetical protein